MSIPMGLWQSVRYGDTIFRLDHLESLMRRFSWRIFIQAENCCLEETASLGRVRFTRQKAKKPIGRYLYPGQEVAI